MELKTARLTILIDPNKKAAFESLCAQQDRTASQVIRQLIRDYLTQHGVEYVPSGLNLDEPLGGKAAGARKRARRKASKRDDTTPVRPRTVRRGA